MKYVFLLASLLLFAVGCTKTKLSRKGADWAFERTSFLQKTEVGKVAVATNGTFSLSGYSNDGGGEATALIVGAAVSAAVNSAK